MRIEANGTCRGSGKIYTRFAVEKLPEDHTLDIEQPIVNGTSIPCSVYEVKQLEDTPTKRLFVGVFPNLSIHACAFKLIELDDKGKQVDSHEYDLNFNRAKWESRLNYRLNKSLCNEIRDYDRIGNYDQADITFWTCIEDKDELIIRGSVYTPYREDSALTITCLKDDGEQLDVSVLNFGNAKLVSPFSTERHRREQQFSVRIPNQIRRYIFVAEDDNHPSFDSFEVLDDVRLKDLLQFNSWITRSAQFDPGYNDWFKNHRAHLGELSKQADVQFKHMPLFSIIVPLFNTPSTFFNDMVQSVRNQSYANWELILVNASPDNTELSGLVSDKAAEDNRIRVVVLEKNLGISENTNAGINVAKGDYVCFFDHDDLLEPDCLFTYAQAINENNDIDMLYCDEDKLLPDGTFGQPFFKPDFDIDLLCSFNYVCHMLTVRKELLASLEPNSSEYDGAQDHNLTLQAAEHTENVYHAPRVLYHWRVNEGSTASDSANKPYASKAGLEAVKSHLKRTGAKAHVELADRPFSYRVTYDVPDSQPLVSIIIPNKDMVPVLDKCLQSILSKSTYDNYEVVIIENNSTDPKTFDYYRKLESEHGDKVRVKTWEHEFNFSKLMNFGAEHAKGDYLILLNNDTEVITSNWIEIMLGLCARQDVGIVGVRLYYPDNTIQHAGVYVTGSAAGHIGKNLPRGDWGYYAFLDSQRELSAVTAACLMTERSSFESVGGFTEKLTVAFNDIDYCLKVRDTGKLVIYTPYVELYHYESISRGAENSPTKRLRFHRETAYLNYQWAKYYILGDPYHNKNLAQDDMRSWYSGLA